jgi:hypothetical protein
VAANLTKINVYYKSEYEMKMGVKASDALGFFKSQVYFSKKNEMNENKPKTVQLLKGISK